MQFAFTDEQAQIRDAVRGFCAEHGSSARVRAAIASADAFDRTTWAEMAAAGWLGLAVAPEHGGAGLGNVEIAILQQEMGRRLLPSPFLGSSVMAARAIEIAGDAAQRARLLPPLCDGSSLATLAFSGERGAPGVGGIDATLEPLGANWLLHGTSNFVLHGHVADLLVVAARMPASGSAGAVSLVALPADAAGVRRERLTMLDLTRPMAHISYDHVIVRPERILGSAGTAGDALERTLDLSRIALAAEQAGVAEGALEMTVEYCRQRVQFGRPIGSFQAVKHRLADMMVLVEACKSAIYYAACSADEGAADLPEAASLAKAWCSDAVANCTANAIQLHGGIGFTWDHDAHLYFKRGRASGTLLGPATYHRARIASRLGLGESAA